MNTLDTKLLNDLYSSYFEALKNKRFKANTRGFACNYEKEILSLYRDIVSRNYEIKTSLCFISDTPVVREIFAGDFRDRVIHHLLYKYLNPLCEPLFINDAYSCRKGKGTSYGVKRAKRFMRSASKNYSQEAYVMKLDIKGYFMSIDKDILYSQVKSILKSDRAKVIYSQKMKNIILYLSKKVIYHDPVLDCRVRGGLSNWHKLPKDKSLFATKENKGLPIGNLTSQLFGNLYLKGLDDYIKKDLKINYYGRYVDDMIFFKRNKKDLLALISKINRYLQVNLDLKLHPKKIYLQEINKGFMFLGKYIRPHRVYVKREIRAKLRLSLSRYCDSSVFLRIYYSYFSAKVKFRLILKVNYCYNSSIMSLLSFSENSIFSLKKSHFLSKFNSLRRYNYQTIIS